MSNPYTKINTKATPQTQPIPGTVGKRQVQNNAGGFVFQVDPWEQLNRFLILGTVGGTYYVSERKLTQDNSKLLFKLVEQDGIRFVDTLVDVSVNGRAQKQQPTLFALAIACAADDDATRAYALAAVQRICRTATMLFTWLGFVDQFRGTGSRGMRNTIGRWYTERPVEKVAYQAIKYRNREGYTHRDLLRIGHPVTVEEDRKALFDWISGRGYTGSYESLSFLTGFEKAQAAKTAKETAQVIRDFNLPWEALNQDHLNDPAVSNALLDVGMPIGALVRQLPRLSRNGVAASRKGDIAKQLRDQDLITKSRLHPMALLNALVTYKNGTGRGGRDWTPVSQLIDALDDAFYLAFGNVTPANKRTLLALDVSGSMGGFWGYAQPSGGFALSPREGSAAMALVTAKTEPDYEFMGFCNKFVKLNISAKQRLDDVVRTVSGLPFGSTDCSLPMTWALKNKVPIDTFCVYTDSETYAGRIHPSQALEQYRQGMGIPARLVVIGMVATEFTIADPKDPGMMDVVGFDTTTPDVISGFSRGDF